MLYYSKSPKKKKKSKKPKSPYSFYEIKDPNGIGYQYILFIPGIVIDSFINQTQEIERFDY